jgi:putative ATPase
MRRMEGRQTLLFVDEIHRFNRAQQDSFLAGHGRRHDHPRRRHDRKPVLRAQRGASLPRPVLTFQPHDEESLEELLKRAEAAEGKPLPLDPDARASLLRMADGDGRAVLTLAEEVWRAARADEVFDTEGLTRIVQRRAPVYDKAQDGHYNLISALHKSVRGSDPDAALYYLARMFDAGEDPLYLGRRLVRMAVEDIGLADPQALVICNAAKDAYDYLGFTRGRAGAGARLRLPRHGAQIERRLYCLQGGDAGGEGKWFAAAAEAHPQCADQADEGRGLRRTAIATTMTSRTPFPARTTFRRRWAPGLL